MEAFNKHGHQLAWDATSINTLLTCPRKYYYTILKGYRAKEKSVHLVFGGLFATAIENFYRYAFETEDPEGALHRVVKEALIESYGNSCWVGETIKTRTTLIRSIVDYIDTYYDNDAPRIHRAKDGTPSLERNFILDIDEQFVLCGRLDRVVYENGQYFIMDQKTTKGTPNASYFDLYTPNTQMSAYLFAGRMIFSKPVKAMILDAVGIGKQKTTFARGIITRTKGQLDEWLGSVRRTLRWSHTLDTMKEDDWYQIPEACGYYSGCEFRKVCSKSPEARKMYLKTDFIKQPWDPVRGTVYKQRKPLAAPAYIRKRG